MRLARVFGNIKQFFRPKNSYLCRPLSRQAVEPEDGVCSKQTPLAISGIIGTSGENQPRTWLCSIRRIIEHLLRRRGYRRPSHSHVWSDFRWNFVLCTRHRPDRPQHRSSSSDLSQHQLSAVNGTLADGRSLFGTLTGATITPCNNRIFPQFQNIQMVESVGVLQYDALTVQVTKQFSRAPQFSGFNNVAVNTSLITGALIGALPDFKAHNQSTFQESRQFQLGLRFIF